MLELSNHSTAIITTERLVIRPFVIDDAEAMFILRSDKEIMKYIPRVLPQTVADAREHLQMVIDGGINEEFFNWGITIRDSDTVIGTIGYFRIKKEHDRAEIGYLLHRDYQRQGIMHEAIQAMIKYGFTTMKLHSIEAVIAPQNIASRELLLKNKFRKEGHFVENEYFDGKYLSTEIYGLLVTEYSSLK